MVTSTSSSLELLRTAPAVFDWIRKVNPHITFDDQGKAILPDSIESMDDITFDQARLAVKHFNSLPRELREAGFNSPVQEAEPQETGGCAPRSHQVIFWWGWRDHLDHCAVQTATIGSSAESGFLAVIASILGSAGITLPAGIAVGAVAAYIQVASAQMNSYDNECANAHVDNLQAGCFLCMSWAAPGVFWVARVC
jgi:hypothetical protein